MRRYRKISSFFDWKGIFYGILWTGILVTIVNVLQKDKDLKNHNNGESMHNDQYGIPGSSIGRPGWTASSREANGVFVVQQDNKVFRIQGKQTSTLNSIDGKIYIDGVEVTYGDPRILSISDNDPNRPAFNVVQQSGFFRTTTAQQKTPQQQSAEIPVNNVQPHRSGGLRIGSLQQNGKNIPLQFETSGSYSGDVMTINGETMIGRNDGKVITVRGGSVSAFYGHLVIDGKEVTSDSDPRIVSIEDGTVREVSKRKLTMLRGPGC